MDSDTDEIDRKEQNKIKFRDSFTKIFCIPLERPERVRRERKNRKRERAESEGGCKKIEGVSGRAGLPVRVMGEELHWRRGIGKREVYMLEGAAKDSTVLVD